MNGTVKTKTDKNFGFISRPGEDKDLFFHANDLEGGLTFDGLQIGAEVSFDLEQGEKGPAAKNVKLAGALPEEAAETSDDADGGENSGAEDEEVAE